MAGDGVHSQSWARPDPNHAWMTRPNLYLSAVGKAQPRVTAAATLGLSVRALAAELKASASVLLGLLDQFSGCVATEETLRSALHLCVRVHEEEVLPGALCFAARGGAAPKEWAHALSRRSRGRNWQPNAPVPTEAELQGLASDSQRALLRSLRGAVELGVEQAADISNRLGGRFCACERLREKCLTARACAKKQGSAVVLAWQRAPMHRKVSDVAATGSQQVDGPFDAGPTLLHHDEEIAMLLRPASAPWEITAPHDKKRTDPSGVAVGHQRKNDNPSGSRRPTRPQTAKATASGVAMGREDNDAQSGTQRLTRPHTAKAKCSSGSARQAETGPAGTTRTLMSRPPSAPATHRQHSRAS